MGLKGTLQMLVGEIFSAFAGNPGAGNLVVEFFGTPLRPQKQALKRVKDEKVYSTYSLSPEFGGFPSSQLCKPARFCDAMVGPLLRKGHSWSNSWEFPNLVVLNLVECKFYGGALLRPFALLALAFAPFCGLQVRALLRTCVSQTY